MRGIINKIPLKNNLTLGYGFIACGKETYFFHRSEFKGTWSIMCAKIKNGEKVEVIFDLELHDGKQRAINVNEISN